MNTLRQHSFIQQGDHKEEKFFFLQSFFHRSFSQRGMLDGLEKHIFCCVDIFSSNIENLSRGHANFSKVELMFAPQM